VSRDLTRTLAVALLIAAGASGFALLERRQDASLATGAPAPEFRLPDRAGRTVELQGLRGRVVLVNFWATWCAPCLEELPSLERLHRTLGPEGLVVLGISVDEQERAIAPVLERFGVTFTVLSDPFGTASAAYAIRAFPETYVVDARGVLRETYRGAVRWDDPGAIDHLRQLLRASR
jgi:cytochrome c biogenesis protein CcmG/thiol:disulfide interchange protein DsbE